MQEYTESVARKKVALQDLFKIYESIEKNEETAIKSASYFFKEVI